MGQTMKYVDLHCDTLTESYHHISLEKLKKGDCFLQCFALYLQSHLDGGKNRFSDGVEAYKKVKAKYEKNWIYTLLTVEDGGVFDTVDELSKAVDAGVKIFGFTWNYKNNLAAPNGEQGGLTTLGKRFAEFLCEKKVLLDVSHLSDTGTMQLACISEKYHRPVVATHSLSRSVFPHPRNLTDEAVKKIADTGGVIGLTFCREFLGDGGFLSHLKHIWSVGGEDVLSIGTDFDGTKNPLVSGADKMPLFFEALSRKLPYSVVEKTAYKNALRVLKSE